MERNDWLLSGLLTICLGLLFLGVSTYEVQFYSAEISVQIASLVGTLSGVAVLLYSFTLNKSKSSVLSAKQTVRCYLIATIISLTAAVCFTVPVLVPEFIFPLKLTIWPGEWMFFSYFTFLIAGVLGGLGWALLWDLSGRYFHVTQTNRTLTILTFSLTYFAIYGETSMMFAVGYNGGSAALIGFGKEIITQGIVGWMVVPIGLFILLYLVGTLFGLANIILALTSRSTIDNKKVLTQLSQS